MEKALVEARFHDIEENYKQILENIARAETARGVDEGSVKFMAVTKTVEPYFINHALSLGIDLIGENRVQELMGLIDEKELRWLELQV